MAVTLDLSTLGPLSEEAASARDRLCRERVAARIIGRDHTLWKPDPGGIITCLGWIDSPVAMAGHLRGIDDLLEGARQEGLTRALVLGMGGSSLAAEVYARLLAVPDGHLHLSILDTTDPATVRDLTSGDPSRTLFLPATKSGGTVETLSLLKYCYNLAIEAVGRHRAGRHFAAITDPDSGLHELARSLGFRQTFLNDPEIGGRYSSLSLFGIVPARLAGADPVRLLAGGLEAREQIVDDGDGLRLGAALGAAEEVGRDKLTLIASPSLGPLGAWIEQLVAESTGKEGRGILPVHGEPPGEPGSYAGDRLFACLKLSGEDDTDALARDLAAAGHPVVRIELDGVHDIGAAMFQWKVATVVAAHLMGINPFDQPNVEAAKVLARSMLDEYRSGGVLPVPSPDLVENGVAAFGPVEGDRLREAIRSFLSVEQELSPRPYVAFHGYLPPVPGVEAALTRTRRRLRDRMRLATTLGYGPRFLHSTGQLHKGDAGHGLFVQITIDDPLDLPIPDAPGELTSTTTFGVLKAAQALGDRQALVDAGRRVLRLHMTEDLDRGIKVIEEAFSQAIGDLPCANHERAAPCNWA